MTYRDKDDVEEIFDIVTLGMMVIIVMILVGTLIVT